MQDQHWGAQAAGGGAGRDRPAPMEGHGAYNRGSRVQGSSLGPAAGLLVAAARAAALPDAPAPLVIADYGASQGRNSLAPIGAALGELRRRAGPGRAVGVIHTDLPGNDFSALFETLESDPGSYLKGDGAVFPSAVGRSFFRQILPGGSVHLGWTSWAVQWLSRVPAPIPDQVQVAFSRDAAARAAFAAQADADWRAFLSARAAELAPGGRLVVLAMATDDSGDFGYGAQVATLYAALEAMAARGDIAADALARMAIPTYGRTRAEFAAPFAGGRFAGLRIEGLDVFHGEDRVFADYAADGDARAFGAKWAGFSRASVFPTLASELGADPARAARFMDALEADAAARLAAAPAPTVIPLAEMTLVRD
ncbi:class I SAM-dependent methyltransferase [Xanthobacter pseudotagetidis]|uniref:hypothetical protein n=1 Tax=Xanthobacter pseudotagetidis TaxID=3119911 RepID=UPI003726B327